jgi:hypothetical protein
VNDAAETLLADELERNANILRQKRSAPADDERVHERVKLVDEVSRRSSLPRGAGHRR